MRSSIKRRLLIGLLSLLIVSCSFTIVKNYYDTRNEIQSLFDAQLAQSARVLLELSTHELYEQLAYVNDISAHIPTQVHKYQQEIDFQIWTHGDHLAVRSENMPSAALINVDDTFKKIIINGEAWQVYAISNHEKDLRVLVGQPFSGRNDLSDGISARLITSFGITIPLMALLIVFVVDRAMLPLRKVATEIKERQVDNLQPLPTDDVPMEALPMIAALNLLFERLKRSFDNIKVFTANAAHELRTPLAAQKVHAQVAMQATDVEHRNEALKEVVLGVNRATNLVEQLLTLARLDPDHKQLIHDSSELRQVSENIVAELVPEAIDKNIEISLDARQDTTVVGPATLITILIRNLVENAIRYTPKDGHVEVKLTEKSGYALLSVADSGPGIPEAERHRVFSRFYRGKNITEDGTGLGLSMVQRVLELLDGQIDLGESKWAGLQVNVLLPLSKIKQTNQDKLTAEKPVAA